MAPSFEKKQEKVESKNKDAKGEKGGKTEKKEEPEIVSIALEKRCLHNLKNGVSKKLIERHNLISIVINVSSKIVGLFVYDCHQL